MANPAATRMLFDLVNESDTFKLLALSLFSGSTAILTFHTRALPLWLGWLGAVLSVILVVGGWSFVLNNSNIYAVLYVALPLLLIWVAALSVVLMRRVA
ncbi:MAG: hypothetical protein JWO42_1830 [Chloroflexi bacterium]|nr:hypothetical protein [Chloroflexota bacterium]